MWDLNLSRLSSINAVTYDGRNAAAIGYDGSNKEVLIMVRDAPNFEADASYSIGLTTSFQGYASESSLQVISEGLHFVSQSQLVAVCGSEIRLI